MRTLPAINTTCMHSYQEQRLNRLSTRKVKDKQPSPAFGGSKKDKIDDIAKILSTTAEEEQSSQDPIMGVDNNATQETLSIHYGARGDTVTGHSTARNKEDLSAINLSDIVPKQHNTVVGYESLENKVEENVSTPSHPQRIARVMSENNSTPIIQEATQYMRDMDNQGQVLNLNTEPKRISCHKVGGIKRRLEEETSSLAAELESKARVGRNAISAQSSTSDASTKNTTKANLPVTLERSTSQLVCRFRCQFGASLQKYVNGQPLRSSDLAVRSLQISQEILPKGQNGRRQVNVVVQCHHLTEQYVKSFMKSQKIAIDLLLKNCTAELGIPDEIELGFKIVRATFKFLIGNNFVSSTIPDVSKLYCGQRVCIESGNGLKESTAGGFLVLSDPFYNHMTVCAITTVHGLFKDQPKPRSPEMNQETVSQTLSRLMWKVRSIQRYLQTQKNSGSQCEEYEVFSDELKHLYSRLREFAFLEIEESSLKGTDTEKAARFSRRHSIAKIKYLLKDLTSLQDLTNTKSLESQLPVGGATLKEVSKLIGATSAILTGDIFKRTHRLRRRTVWGIDDENNSGLRSIPRSVHKRPSYFLLTSSVAAHSQCNWASATGNLDWALLNCPTLASVEDQDVIILPPNRPRQSMLSTTKEGEDDDTDDQIVILLNERLLYPTMRLSTETVWLSIPPSDDFTKLQVLYDFTQTESTNISGAQIQLEEGDSGTWVLGYNSEGPFIAGQLVASQGNGQGLLVPMDVILAEIRHTVQHIPHLNQLQLALPKIPYGCIFEKRRDIDVSSIKPL